MAESILRHHPAGHTGNEGRNVKSISSDKNIISFPIFLKLQGWKSKYQNKVTAILPNSTIHKNLMEELGIDVIKV